MAARIATLRSSRRTAIPTDYRARGGGTQPRLRAGRRVAYPRPPMARMLHLIVALLVVAALTPAAALAAGPAATRSALASQMRSAGGGSGALAVDLDSGRQIYSSPPRHVTHPRVRQQALHDRHRAHALRRRGPSDDARARRRRRRPRRRADRRPLPARRRRSELRLAPGRRARRPARARRGPARGHGARDRRRVGLRLAARPAVRGLPDHERGRAAERADLQPRPLRAPAPLLPGQPGALRRARVRARAAAPRRDHRRRLTHRPHAAGRADAGRALLADDGRARPASPTGRRTTSTPRR